MPKANTTPQVTFSHVTLHEAILHIQTTCKYSKIIVQILTNGDFNWPLRTPGWMFGKPCVVRAEVIPLLESSFQVNLTQIGIITGSCGPSAVFSVQVTTLGFACVHLVVHPSCRILLCRANFLHVGIQALGHVGHLLCPGRHCLVEVPECITPQLEELLLRFTRKDCPSPVEISEQKRETENNRQN